MSMTHDYRYDLEISGADEAALQEFHKAFYASLFGDRMLPDPENPACFSTEYAFGHAGFFEEDLEEALHDLALRFPQVTLTFTAEDLDDSGHSYQLILHGDSYQRSDLTGFWTDFTPPAPFSQRMEIRQNEEARLAKATEMITHLCKHTDYDLLYAQKEALLALLTAGEPAQQEALMGLIEFLDHVGDLGEVLGRFRYEGIDPPFPLLPNYEKRQVEFKPEPESLKETVHHLYDRMLMTHNQNNDAFYIASNLAYLARSVDTNPEIPLDSLYDLSVRINDAAGSSIQPLLNEERLDALRYLLEYGAASVDPAFKEIGPASMPEFLLQCSQETFLQLVERTAYANQEKFASEIDYDHDTDFRDQIQQDIAAFLDMNSKNSLDQKLNTAQLNANSRESFRIQADDRDR